MSTNYVIVITRNYVNRELTFSSGFQESRWKINLCFGDGLFYDNVHSDITTHRLLLPVPRNYFPFHSRLTALINQLSLFSRNN